MVVLAIGFDVGGHWWKSLALIGSAVLLGLLCIRGQGLFLARVSSVRVVELTRITRAAPYFASSAVVSGAYFGDKSSPLSDSMGRAAEQPPAPRVSSLCPSHPATVTVVFSDLIRRSPRHRWAWMEKVPAPWNFRERVQLRL